MSDGQRLKTSLFFRAILSLAGFLVILGLMLFVPAGDIRWPLGWLFILVFSILTILGIGYLRLANPDIFVARSRMTRAGTKGWDKVLVRFLLLSFLAIFVVAGLDAGRIHASKAPPWLIVVGYVLLCGGYILSIWVYGVNKFAEPTVRIQTDRGHTVIDTGPYAIVRHPLYSAAILMSVGIALSLGSYWALIPAAAMTLIIVIRTALEDRTLQRELEGYTSYAARVRHRLIPGMW